MNATAATEDQRNTPQRDHLASTIRRRAAETARLSDLQGALARANDLVDSITAELERHDAGLANEASQMAANLADQLRTGDATAEHSPTKPVADRAAIDARLKVAVQARDQLQQEVEAAQKAVGGWQNEVREAALEVMRLDVARITAELEHHYSEIYRLRDWLRGMDFASYSFGGSTEWAKRPKMLDHRAVVALEIPPAPQFVGGHDPAKDRADDWRGYFGVLKDDPEAQFSE